MAVMASDTPLLLDLEIVRGSSTETLIFTLAFQGGVPVDLTGWTFDLEAIDPVTGATVLSATSANGHITNQGTAGTWTLVYSKTETLAMVATGLAKLPYAMRATEADGATTHLTHKGGLAIVTEPSP